MTQIRSFSVPSESLVVILGNTLSDFIRITQIGISLRTPPFRRYTIQGKSF